MFCFHEWMISSPALQNSGLFHFMQLLPPSSSLVRLARNSCVFHQVQSHSSEIDLLALRVSVLAFANASSYHLWMFLPPAIRCVTGGLFSFVRRLMLFCKKVGAHQTGLVRTHMSFTRSQLRAHLPRRTVLSAAEHSARNFSQLAPCYQFGAQDIYIPCRSWMALSSSGASTSCEGSAIARMEAMGVLSAACTSTTSFCRGRDGPRLKNLRSLLSLLREISFNRRLTSHSFSDGSSLPAQGSLADAEQEHRICQSFAQHV